MKLIIEILKKISVTTIIILGAVACDHEEFLDNTNKTNLTDQTQWQSEGNADIFLNDCYSEILIKWNKPDQLDYYTDDYNISHYYTASNWRQGICQVPAVSTTNDWGGTQGPNDGYSWELFFKKIRKCNTFIEKLNKNKENFSEEYFNKRMDEAKFLRAFFYSEYFMHVGGLPIFTNTLDRNTMSDEELQKPRASFQETFDFITSELGQIMDNGNLEIKYNNGEKDAGRATLGATLALKGWIELFAASPLFNSGIPYLSDPDNLVHFATADENRWKKAAETNKKFIDIYGNGSPYSLFAVLLP